jgi:hypothetical protein
MSDRNLAHLYPPFALLIPKIQADYQTTYPDRLLLVDSVWRMLAEQQALWAVGRTRPPLGRRFYVTMRDGIRLKSNHQNVDPKGNPCSLAVDFFIEVGGKAMWNRSFYVPLIQLALKYGVTSGLDWNRTGRSDDDEYSLDPPHIEIHGLPDYTYLNAPIST